MKYLNTFNLNEDHNSEKIEMPSSFSHTGAILNNDKFWIVYVFISPKDGSRFKSMSKNSETFANLVNVIKGGTDANEIAGIFKTKESAKELFDLLKYRAERTE